MKAEVKGVEALQQEFVTDFVKEEITVKQMSIL